MTLVDSNVLLDLFTQEPVWLEWSLHELQKAAKLGPLLVNDVIYAETSIRFGRVEEFDQALVDARITVAPIPRRALFLAGKAFARYRGSGGVRSGVPPEFFIGAHADIERLPLLTRDVRRYRTYFPEVQLIAPSGADKT